MEANKVKAVFPGSFDPITNGHLDIIERASKIFDEVVVVVANNTGKKSLFTPNEKFELISSAIAKLNNVTVKLMDSDLAINIVKKLNGNVLIRGVRNEVDFTYEQSIALMNRKLDSTIETLILFSDPNKSFISSTLVREISLFGGDLSDLVPKNVETMILKKRGN
ncbi:phosphopantetheine adenylyltransferase [Ligilactobacillus hayakitensis DSM 18933 = JCM 14209]|uniref:Phosphopantetheine adenylyltransferase n=1 Tax=Ligilactobacillus hayakitensis DSM 18933 = JCM 14209 TaxID=1423755 RepID=A0A0R1WXP5_9LACO|nr:phosphopantetheine adenylyltransferase [Ligilactobacillus hayakitensis DSM 18933 = JCM 14209]